MDHVADHHPVDLRALACLDEQGTVVVEVDRTALDLTGRQMNLHVAPDGGRVAPGLGDQGPGAVLVVEGRRDVRGGVRVDPARCSGQDVEGDVERARVAGVALLRQDLSSYAVHL